MNIFQLKIIAMIAMFLDHIAYFFPDLPMSLPLHQMLEFLMFLQKKLLKQEVHQDLVRYGTSRVKGNTILLVPLIIKTCILIISLQEKRVIRFM